MKTPERGSQAVSKDRRTCGGLFTFGPSVRPIGRHLHFINGSGPLFAELGASVRACDVRETSMTTGLISTLLETRQAAKAAYLAKTDRQRSQNLDGLTRQMFDHLTTDELAEMAMIHPETMSQSAAA